MACLLAAGTGAGGALFYTVAEAEEAAPATVPIDISADWMEANNEKKVVQFGGNVVAKRETMTIHADELWIYSLPEGGRIDRIVARGNVLIEREEQKASAEEATYYETDQKIVLRGHPRAWQDRDVITGVEMTLYLQDDRVVVSGDHAERIRVTLFPEKGEMGFLKGQDEGGGGGD